MIKTSIKLILNIYLFRHPSTVNRRTDGCSLIPEANNTFYLLHNAPGKNYSFCIFIYNILKSCDYFRAISFLFYNIVVYILIRNILNSLFLLNSL
jgi:hypothetical protein